MRALLGILVLGGLFLAAAAWQRSHTRVLREQRRSEYGLPENVEQGRADGEWSLLVLGRPSGAPPLVDGSGPAAPGPGEGADDGAAAADAPEPEYAPDARYEVLSGDHLGGICQRHYGTARPALVEAVARYNALASPDAIRAGSILLLPDRGLLGR